MKDQGQSDVIIFPFEGENFNINNEGEYLVFKLSPNKQVKEFSEEQPEGEESNKAINNTLLSKSLTPDPKARQNKVNMNPVPGKGESLDEAPLDRAYLFFNYLGEENNKKKNIFNPNPLNIEYTKDNSENIKSIKIPIAIWNEFQKSPKEEGGEKNGAVAFGGERAGIILSEINSLKKDDNQVNVLNGKVNALVKSLGATDEAERQKKEGYKKKITSFLALPLFPFLAGYEKYQEYKQSKIDVEKDKDSKINHLKIPENSNRFNFTSYEFNGLLHCDVSYIGDKKKNDNGGEIAGKNYGTSTILLEGSLKKKFLEIEKRYPSTAGKEAEKKLAQLNLLGSYFVSSGKADAVGGKDKIPQLNLENPKGKQKIKFSVSVNKDDKKVKLVSYNIDKDTLAEIKKDVGAMNKIEKYFFVKLPSSEASYVKCEILRNNEGKLSIKPDLTMVYDKNLFASSNKEKVEAMNKFLEGCNFQIASSVEREKVAGNQQDKNNNGDAPKKTVYREAPDNPETKINLTGKNLLDKLSESSKKGNPQQK